MEDVRQSTTAWVRPAHSEETLENFAGADVYGRRLRAARTTHPGEAGIG